MGLRVVLSPAFSSDLPADFRAFADLGGRTVALSGSTRTVRGALAGVDLHVKRHDYPVRRALAGALRNTFRRPSRAAREFRMLTEFARRGAAPAAAAFGEDRWFGFLRQAFVASVTADGGVPSSEAPPDSAGAAAALGAFLGRVHRDGLCHGRLFARNLLVLPDGTFLLVDLDRATCRPGRMPSRGARGWDLACLAQSLGSAPAALALRAFAAYRRATGESREEARDLAREVDRRRPEAAARLARRVSRGGRTSPSSSGARPG